MTDLADSLLLPSCGKKILPRRVWICLVGIRFSRFFEKQHVELKRHYPIRRLALFGSWARGDAHEDSDVDVLVDVDPSIGLKFVQLAEELEAALGRHVDLVFSPGDQARVLGAHRTGASGCLSVMPTF